MGVPPFLWFLTKTKHFMKIVLFPIECYLLQKKIMKAGLFKDDVKGTDALFNLISYCEKMMKIILQQSSRSIVARFLPILITKEVPKDDDLRVRIPLRKSLVTKSDYQNVFCLPFGLPNHKTAHQVSIRMFKP